MYLVLHLFVCAALSVGSANAEPIESLSFAHIFSNDFLGDGQDRWRTASFALSALEQPNQLGGDHFRSANYVLEFRLRSEIIAPSNLANPSPTDRPYAGILSLGIHRHRRDRGLETSTGIDVVAVGQQTGLQELHMELHRLFGADSFGSTLQVGNAVFPTMLGELARPIALNARASLRPFVELQAGAETFVRAGVDLDFGRNCLSIFKLRDVTTGQRYPASACQEELSTVASLGLDVARVFDSQYLPAEMGPEATEARSRIRLGITRIGKRGSSFFGLTWLGEEFRGQSEGQLVGSISVNFRF